MRRFPIIFCLFSLTNTSFGRFVYPERTAFLRQKYSDLYDLNVKTLSDGTRSFGEARHFQRGGIQVLYLKGDRFEMAYQHGRLLHSQILEGPIRASAKMIDRELRHALGTGPKLTRKISNIIHRRYSEAIVRYAHQQTGELAYQGIDAAIGVSEATGIELNTVLRAFLTPEVLMVVAADLAKEGGEASFVNPAVNCTSFFAWDQASKDNATIIGRNTDFPLNGYYDKHPTVIYFHPTDGDLKYMTVGSAGVHNAGVFAINEKGIYLASHTVPAKASSKAGIPVFSQTEQIIRQAKTFDEAVELFKTYPPPAGWAYVLASVKEKRFGSIEMDNQKMAFRESKDGFHVQSNRFQTTSMDKRELFVNPSVDLDANARYQRTEELIKTHWGKLDLEKATSILADDYDPIWQGHRGVPNTIAVPTNLSSVVYLPDESKLYVANGTAPVSQNTYIEFPTVEKFKPDQFNRQLFKQIAKNRKGHSHNEDKIKAAVQKYIQAKMVYEYDADAEDALHYLEEALELRPENPAYWFLAGMTALKAGRHNLAMTYLEKVKGSNAIKHRKQVAQYYQGRILSHQRQRRQALSIYQDLLQQESLSHKLLVATNKAIRKTKRIRRYPIKWRDVRIMYQQADMLVY